MRMWGINPKLMCRRHLLGEHVEMHMAYGSLLKNKNIDGFKNGLVDFVKIISRHDELVQELLRRNYKHNTIMDFKLPININYVSKNIDIEHNKKELMIRCKDCRKLINESEL